MASPAPPGAQFPYHRNEAMDLERYKGEMDRLKGQRQERADRGALEALAAFCQRVGQGLERMGFEERQQLLQLVVEGITVEEDRVRVETVIPIAPDGKLRTLRGELVEP